MLRLIIKIVSITVFVGSCIWFYYERSFGPAITCGGALIAALGAFLSKQNEKLENVILTLYRNRKDIKDFTEYLQYSFQRKEFIHPKIIQDLKGWLSDSGEQIVSINILDSQKSNRYFGDFQIKESSSRNPWVLYKDNQESFAYRYIGISKSGIVILHIWECGGGSSVFNYLIFLVFETDESYSSEKVEKKKRINLKTLGLYSLGDQYDGEIEFKGKRLKIGKDQGRFADRNKPVNKYITVN